jgi:type VI protein secretion system component Hcp
MNTPSRRTRPTPASRLVGRRARLATAGGGGSAVRCEPLEARRLLAASVVDDAVNAGFGVPTVIQPGTLLGNDTDIGSIPNFTQPANGTVTRDPVTGNFTYTPKPGFSGPDGFTYSGRAFTVAAGATLYIGEGDLNGDGKGVGVGGGEVTVDSFAVSVVNPDGPFVGVPAGAAQAGTFDFTVGLGAASPGFLAAVASGRTVDRLTLIQRAASDGSGPAERVRWTLTDARFLRYAQADAPGTTGPAPERFSVSFATATMSVTSAGASPTSSAGVNLTTPLPNKFPLAVAGTTPGLFLEATAPDTGAGFSLAAGATAVSDFSFDVVNTRSQVGAPVGRSDFGDVEVTLPAGDGSGPLLVSAALGKRWGQVALVRRALVAGKVVEVERYVLTNARVTSYAQAGAEADTPADTATLAYESIQATLVPVNNGVPGTPVTTTYSRLTNATTGPSDFGRQTLADRPSSLVLDLGAGQLAVDDYAWEASRDVAQVRPGDNAPHGENASVADFTFTARPGPATAGLLAAAADQRTLTSVTLSRRDATGETGREVTRWTLSGVRVSAFGLAVDAAGNPVMTFALAAVKVAQRADFLSAAGDSMPVTASYDQSVKTGDNAPFRLDELAISAQGLKLDLGGGLKAADLLVSAAEWSGLANALLPGTATPAGRPAVGAVTLTAATTQNSPGLFAAAVGVKGSIDTVTLTLTKPSGGGGNVDLFTYTLSNVLVGRYAVADKPAGGGSVETFTLHFTKVEVAAVVISPTTGLPGAPKKAAYDAAAATNFATGAGAFPQTAPLGLAKESAAGNRLQATGPSAPLTAAEAGAVNVRTFSLAIDNDKAGAKEGFLPVTVTLDAGPASLAFLRAAATGAKWSQIVLTAGSGGTNPFVRTRLTLGNARVISYQTSIDGAATGTAVDTITLSYDTIRLAVTPVDGAGKPLAALVTNVNVLQNTTMGNSAIPTRALPTNQGYVLDLPADVAVASFAWSEANTETRPGTGGTPGRVQFADFALTAPAGSASAGLLLRAYDGKNLGTGIKFLGRALSGGGLASLWGLDNVFVVAYSTAVDAQGVATDTFQLEAVAVAETASAPGGAALNTARWNSANNTGTAPPTFGRRPVPGPAQTFTGTVRIAVPGAANRPPTGLVINPQTTDPDDGVVVSQLVDPFDGAPVGILNATDPDAGDALTFSLLNTAGGRFALVGTTVQVADGGRIAGNTRYTITARVTDKAGAFVDRDFVVDVPAVTQVGSVLIVNGTDGTDRFSFTQGATANSLVSVTINGVTLNNLSVAQVIVNGGDGDDLVGAAQLQVPTILRGGAGNDSLFGGTAADTLVGGDGGDGLNGNAGPDTLLGGRGNDTLDGGAGDDLLDGGDDDDVLTGNLGADQIFGGNGNDRARFPDDTDTIDLGPGQLDGVEFVGTGGNDTIVIDVRIYRLPDDPHPELTDAQFDAAAEAGTVRHGHLAVARINGQTVAAPYLNGETIFVLAGAGDDVVTATPDAGHHWRMNFRGGTGNDVLAGGEKDDQLFGDAGADALDGGDGDDFLDGGADRDVLRGGAGADRLLGGTGRDSLFGGADADYLDARDSFVDVVDGGTGTDRTRKDDDDVVTAVEQVLP